MKHDKLYRGTLLKRYKRFLADIKLDNNKIITAACPNTGSMLTCSEPGSLVYVSKSTNPNRKFPFTWELVQSNGTLVGINTGIPNKLVHRYIKKGAIPELAGYPNIRKEVKYGENSRIDILLSRNGERCYVEVKNVTLVENNIAYFPDAVTLRGTKHLNELMNVIDKGHRAVMFYVVQRSDAREFKPAVHIDPVYAETLTLAHNKGVEILVYQAVVSPEEITLGDPLPFSLD